MYRCRLRLSSMTSSAATLHCASCSFCRTASDFLEACFVKQSAIRYLASIHLKSVSPHTALALTMASSIANILSVDAGAAPSLCIASYRLLQSVTRILATRREKLFVILKHKFTTGHSFQQSCAIPSRCSCSRHAVCLCSQTAADNPLDFLALPT